MRYRRYLLFAFYIFLESSRIFLHFWALFSKKCIFARFLKSVFGHFFLKSAFWALFSKKCIFAHFFLKSAQLSVSYLNPVLRSHSPYRTFLCRMSPVPTTRTISILVHFFFLPTRRASYAFILKTPFSITPRMRIMTTFQCISIPYMISVTT